MEERPIDFSITSLPRGNVVRRPTEEEEPFYLPETLSLMNRSNNLSQFNEISIEDRPQKEASVFRCFAVTEEAPRKFETIEAKRKRAREVENKAGAKKASLCCMATQ